MNNIKDITFEIARAIMRISMKVSDVDLKKIHSDLNIIENNVELLLEMVQSDG